MDSKDAQNVKLTGDQNIGGAKTFTNRVVTIDNPQGGILFTKPDLTLNGTPPATDMTVAEFLSRDKNNNVIGNWQLLCRAADGAVENRLGARNRNSSGTEFVHFLRLITDVNGYGRVNISGCRPNADANNEEVPDTYWVNNRITELTNTWLQHKCVATFSRPQKNTVYSQTLSTPLEDPSKILVLPIVKVVEAVGGYSVGDIIYLPWSQDFRNISYWLNKTQIGFAIADQLTTVQKNAYHSFVHLEGKVDILFYLYQLY